MSTNNSGMTDGARAELNRAAEDEPFEDLDPDWDADEIARRQTAQPDPVPGRPADGAKKAAWVDYCVALGADRTFLTQDTEHHDDETGKPVTEPGLSREQLIDLAGRLGG